MNEMVEFHIYGCWLKWVPKVAWNRILVAAWLLDSTKVPAAANNKYTQWRAVRM